MRTLQEMREYFRGDQFAMDIGIEIDSLTEEGAVCSVPLREGLSNALGRAQGGMIFTLADFAFAVAINGQGCQAVTLSAEIRYFGAPDGKRLIAEASCKHRGGKTCTYLVEVWDDIGTNVALLTATGYIRG